MEMLLNLHESEVFTRMQVKFSPEDVGACITVKIFTLRCWYVHESAGFTLSYGRRGVVLTWGY